MSKDYLHHKWKTPAQLDAEQNRPSIPGKTRAQLEEDSAELRRQVDRDLKILHGYQRRNGKLGNKLDRSDFLILGLLAGIILMLALDGGCRARFGLRINSKPHETQNNPTGD